MTEKRHFSLIWKVLYEFVYKKGIVSDVVVMAKLDFSPPSWKVWKPQFVEASKNYVITTTDNTNKQKINYQIVYDKKRKSWYSNILETSTTE